MADNFDQSLYYRITRLDKKNSILVLRDATPPKLVSVGGRWDVVNRPRRVSFTTWNGSDPYRMDLPILIDGLDDDVNVQPDIAFINNLRLAQQAFSPPPQVEVEGAIPVESPDEGWVVESIDFGDNVIWHPKGYRLRQDAVLHLLQYIPITSLSIKPGSTAHMRRVRSGDTLKSISKDEYGTTKYWSAIKNANGLRDVKKLPKYLKIPPIVSPSG